MSDDPFVPWERQPEPDRPGPGPDPDRVAADVAALSELIAGGAEVDGRAEIAESTWVIYGHTTYDGEIVLGEYPDPAEAAEVMDATRRRGLDGDGGVL
jgi:hypothetical protein